ncbi:hypothetical protein [Halarchaeum sp. P4]|uniref:hypothetical protein n=1 Tax=Halarchaeum sp. P4 TaxID=3421639 RepID=UPI003EBE2750
MKQSSDPSQAVLVTDGGHAVDRRSPSEWQADPGERLPASGPHGKVWLFTCCECGRRYADTPGPVSACGCGSEQIVCHRFERDDYRRLRRGEPL